MRRRDKYVIAKCVVRSLIYQFKIFILTAICFDILGTRKCQNFKFLTKSRFTTNRTCYTLLNFRKNLTGGVICIGRFKMNVDKYGNYVRKCM
jgi:hypothetical protein